MIKPDGLGTYIGLLEKYIHWIAWRGIFMKKIFIDVPLTDEIILPADTTHHLLNVFRHKMSKPVLVGGSDGRTATYELLDVTDGQARARMLADGVVLDDDVEIVLVQGFLKADKLELVLQKATELNAHTLYAANMKNCVAQYKDNKLPQKIERWQKIIKEAAQQCGRSKLPVLEAQLSVEEIIAKETNPNTLMLVAYENEQSLTLKEALQRNGVNGEENSFSRVLIFIGPEGGLTPQEVADFEEAGVKSVTLGHTILRAETAAIGAVSMLQYELNM